MHKYQPQNLSPSGKVKSVPLLTEVIQIKNIVCDKHNMLVCLQRRCGTWRTVSVYRRRAPGRGTLTRRWCTTRPCGCSVGCVTSSRATTSGSGASVRTSIRPATLMADHLSHRILFILISVQDGNPSQSPSLAM